MNTLAERVTMRTRFLLRALVATLFLMPAFAAKPVVKIVPQWGANPYVPADAIAGVPMTFKGTSDSEGSNFIFTWKFGDGGTTATGIVTNRYAIETRFAYPDYGLGYTFTVRNTLTGESGSASSTVRLAADTIDTRSSIAIDEGLWYLHKMMKRDDSGPKPAGDWTSLGSDWALTAACVNAFFAAGHIETGPASDPYTETVQRAMTRIFQDYLGPVPIGTQTFGNPDSNGNGIGIRVKQAAGQTEAGFFLAALAQPGLPERRAAAGPAGIFGRTYSQIAADMTDYYSYCQSDLAAPVGGGWGNSCNAAPNNWISQGAALGYLLAQRKFNTAIPSFITERDTLWLNYTQAADGTFGFSDTTPLGGPYTTTPSGGLQLVLTGTQRGAPQWDKYESYMRANFNNTGGPTVAIKDYFYTLATFARSMQLYLPNEAGSTQGIRLLGGDLDWYGDPVNGVGPMLIARQDLGTDPSTHGRWCCYGPAAAQTVFDTPLAIGILAQQRYGDGGAVAYGSAFPNPAYVTVAVSFNAQTSYSKDPTKQIVSYEWDYDNNGVVDATGVKVTQLFGIGDFTVHLRVTDNSVPARTADYYFPLTVSDIN